MSHELVVQRHTQRIIVDRVTRTASVIQAGPAGPPGPQGIPGGSVNAYTGQGPFTIRMVGQAEYDALIPDPDTLYFVTGP